MNLICSLTFLVAIKKVRGNFGSVQVGDDHRVRTRRNSGLDSTFFTHRNISSWDICSDSYESLPHPA
jgi:hypothetical protein